MQNEIFMEYAALVVPERVASVMEAVAARGIKVEILDSKESALSRLLNLIPDGVSMMTAASVTLQEIGFEEELNSGRHKWQNLRAEMRAENDPVKRSLLRRQSSLADFCVGSVNAIAETGELVVASQTGSQLSPYLSCDHVIWVAGTQKIVPTLDDAIRRVRDYCAPKVEELGKKTLGRDGAGTIGKLLILEGESAFLKRDVHLILVNEILGF
ncbi:MAG: lactate utilization protein [Candidatus Kryptoniota bacterium]